MQWLIVVLLPKSGGDFHGIGLLKIFWKVVDAIMDRRIQVIDFHDSLHGFLSKRGTGTITVEAKLAQQLVYLEQQALYIERE